jgi:hypothetical protein
MNTKSISKKELIIIIIISVLLAVLLIPVPLSYKDGGSVEYCAIAYSVRYWHAIGPYVENEDMRYYVGTTVEIFGVEVYDSMHLESAIDETT